MREKYIRNIVFAAYERLIALGTEWTQHKRKRNHISQMSVL